MYRSIRRYAARHYWFIALLLASLALLLALVRRAAAYSNPILYFGSAVIQAYAALVAIPFTIWVIYMERLYGALVVRLSLAKVSFPFLILAVVTAVSGITIALSDTGYAHAAYYIEFTVAVLLLPPLFSYIVDLMTMTARDVVELVEKNARSDAEFLSSALHILRLYMLEAHHDDESIRAILRRIERRFSRMDRIEPNPEVWHRFRDLLKTIVTETGYLPPISSMKRITTSFMAWLVANKKTKVARSFIRYYRRLTQRYVEEGHAIEATRSLFLHPTVVVLRSMRAPVTLQSYALEQLHLYLRRMAHLARYGDLTKREVCHILDDSEDALERVEDVPGKQGVEETIERLRGEFGCPRRAARRKKTPARQASRRQSRKAEKPGAGEAGRRQPET